MNAQIWVLMLTIVLGGCPDDEHIRAQWPPTELQMKGRRIAPVINLRIDECTPWFSLAVIPPTIDDDRRLAAEFKTACGFLLGVDEIRKRVPCDGSLREHPDPHNVLCSSDSTKERR